MILTPIYNTAWYALLESKKTVEEISALIRAEAFLDSSLFYELITWHNYNLQTFNESDLKELSNKILNKIKP